VHALPLHECTHTPAAYSALFSLTALPSVCVGRCVAVGDVLLIKGTQFPDVRNALVHKSPEKRYDADGNVISRLVLKVDTDTPRRDPTIALPCSPPRAAPMGPHHRPPLLTTPCCHWQVDVDTLRTEQAAKQEPNLVAKAIHVTRSG
jgi:hypothetical protein